MWIWNWVALKVQFVFLADSRFSSSFVPVFIRCSSSRSFFLPHFNISYWSQSQKCNHSHRRLVHTSFLLSHWKIVKRVKNSASFFLKVSVKLRSTWWFSLSCRGRKHKVVHSFETKRQILSSVAKQHSCVKALECWAFCIINLTHQKHPVCVKDDRRLWLEAEMVKNEYARFYFYKSGQNRIYFLVLKVNKMHNLKLTTSN